MRKVKTVHASLFGEDVDTMPVAVTGSEDFGDLARPRSGKAIPMSFWFLGGTARSRWSKLQGGLMDRLQAVPADHSPFYYPNPDPTLRRGVEALASAALAYLEPAAA